MVPFLVATSLFVLAGPAFAQESASVSIVDNEFDPVDVEVDADGTVTWTNNGDLPHTVTADNDSFESGNLDPGDTFEQVFTDAGTYSYYCEYHGASGGTGMAGTVTVAGGGADDPTDPPDDNGDGQGDDTSDDDTLPNTGAGDLLAYVYLAAVLIGMGGIFLRLQRA
jgi:LPXTG-motif cell wall-anchored protein